ncbi:MAG: hypothetical protein AAFX99_33740, partial [Myxococcota bacterium]
PAQVTLTPMTLTHHRDGGGPSTWAARGSGGGAPLPVVALDEVPFFLDELLFRVAMAFVGPG